MGFTAWEFIRGATMAPLVFLLLSPASWVVVAVVAAIAARDPAQLSSAGMMLVLIPAYASPWAAGATLVLGAPLAWLLGRALRRVARIRIHVVAFAVLGALVGAVTCVVAPWFMFPASVSGTTMFNGLIWSALLAPASAVAVAFSWWRTASWALRDDARAEPQPAGDSS